MDGNVGDLRRNFSLRNRTCIESRVEKQEVIDCNCFDTVGTMPMIGIVSKD